MTHPGARSTPRHKLASTALPLLAALALACGDSGETSSTSDGASESDATSEGGTDGTAGTTIETSTSATNTDTDGTTTGEPLPTPDVPEGCNPVAYESDCLLPYPSDVFLVTDMDMPNGVRVELTPAATPKTMADQPYDVFQSHPADGFSAHMPIMALFPEGVDTSNLVFHTDGGDATLDASSVTILLNAESGELVPHWVELDAMASDVSRQALIVRPFVRLDDSTRYIVAFQGLMSADGSPIAAPHGFAHILAGETEENAALDAVATRYEEQVFPALEQAGVARDGLQLAWDFTTASEERNTRDMLAIRSHLMGLLDNSGPAIDINAVKIDPNEDIHLRIEGKFEVPLSLEADEPMARLHRDGAGKVVPNGTHWVDFTLQVPNSAYPEAEGFTPARIIQFGHGFFGLREEINWSAMRAFSSERGFIMVSTNWVGMAEPDQPAVVDYIANHPSDSFLFTDRLHQAFANQMALSYAIKFSLPKAPELQAFDQLLYDTEQLYWYGISQGSIFGLTFLALSPTIEKAVLSVGGAPYTLMMTRSGTFADLFNVIKFTIGNDPLTIQKFITLSQHTLDRVDPISYLRHILLDPYEGSPSRKILFQYGIGDHSVNNLASHVALRATGFEMLEPTAEQPYLVPSTAGPVDGSAAVVVDYNLDVLPGVYAELPPDEEQNDVHEQVRRNPKIKEQIDVFLTPGGKIENFCDGPCDPE